MTSINQQFWSQPEVIKPTFQPPCFNFLELTNLVVLKSNLIAFYSKLLILKVGFLKNFSEVNAHR